MASWFSELTAQWPNLLWIAGAASFLTFTGTLILLPLILIRIPPDYFIRVKTEREDPPPLVLRILKAGIFGLKNILGALLILMGLVMLFTPGQGLLTILAGLLMMNFPGKRTLEIRMISREGIFSGINTIRRKAGREELIRPPEEPPHRKAT